LLTGFLPESPGNGLLSSHQTRVPAPIEEMQRVQDDSDLGPAGLSAGEYQFGYIPLRHPEILLVQLPQLPMEFRSSV
jgi:hypothetical protein